MRKLLWISSCFVVCVLVSICVFFWNDIFGYKTLEKAVQSTWKYPLHVVNVDQQNELVLSLDQTQYVFAAYEQKNGRYHYDTIVNQVGQRVQMWGLPFWYKRNRRTTKGILYGALYIPICLYTSLRLNIQTVKLRRLSPAIIHLS